MAADYNLDNCPNVDDIVQRAAVGHAVIFGQQRCRRLVAVGLFISAN